MAERSGTATVPPRPEQPSYDPVYYRELFAIEDRHFWFRARNRIIAALATRIGGGLPPGYRVIEVGCGTGTVLRALVAACARGTVVGMDLFAEGLSYARRRTACPLVRADLHQPPFAVRFDLIGMFDVLEHLADDRRVLADVRGLLAPGGTLLLTVPAEPSLWSYYDEAAHHRRRYTRGELEGKLVGAGFKVTYLTHYMAILFPLLWLRRRAAGLAGARAAGGAQRARDLTMRELRVTPVVNGLLAALLRLDARRISRGGVSPIGTSLLAMAVRG